MWAPHKKIKAFISSPANKLLLSRYALKKLKQKWQAQDLEAIVDLYLESTIDNLFETPRYDSWQQSPQNVAELNLIVWTTLEAAVNKSLQSCQQKESDVQKAIDDMLDAKKFATEDREESVTIERLNVTSKEWC